MSVSPVYLLDSNVFIEAKRRYYAFDIAPAFWQALIRLTAVGKVKSIDRVKNEIDRGKDDLSIWINGEFRDAFATTDNPDVLVVYGDIIAWSQNQIQFSDAAKAEFARLDNADAWVVAYAATYEYVVVTHEEFIRDVRQRIPIPNVCLEFGVSYIDTFQMLRALDVKLG
jgi:hypothetical protein